jgi:hypothetical protein
MGQSRHSDPAPTTSGLSPKADVIEDRDSNGAGQQSRQLLGVFPLAVALTQAEAASKTPQGESAYREP